MPWKCRRLPERKSNPITVFPTGLALLETLYPIWGTLSRDFRLSATAGSLFLYRPRSFMGWGVWRTGLENTPFGVHIQAVVLRLWRTAKKTLVLSSRREAHRNRHGRGLGVVFALAASSGSGCPLYKLPWWAPGWGSLVADGQELCGIERLTTPKVRRRRRLGANFRSPSLCRGNSDLCSTTTERQIFKNEKPR